MSVSSMGPYDGLMPALEKMTVALQKHTENPYAELASALQSWLVSEAEAADAADIARAAKNGILIKGGLYLELLAKADVIVFDKTGTLTVGQPTVVGIYSIDPSVDENTVLILAAAADRRSGHPLAKAVVEEVESGKSNFTVEIFPGMNASGFS